MVITKAVIPAAGLGTRFWPITKSQPKEMLPVVDKPVIHYVVEEAVARGISEILLIVGKGKESIINYFDKHNLDETLGKEYGFDKFPDILFVRQKEQKGLADALRCACSFTGDSDFVVLLGDTIYVSSIDVPVTAQILAAYNKVGNPVLAIEKVPKKKIKDYGIVAAKRVDEGLWRIEDLVEKPDPETAPSDLGITGTYVLTPGIYDCIERLEPGKNGEYQLTDALRLLRKDTELFGTEFKGTRYDIGTKELWKRADLELSRKDPRFAQLYG